MPPKATRCLFSRRIGHTKDPETLQIGGVRHHTFEPRMGVGKQGTVQALGFPWRPKRAGMLTIMYTYIYTHFPRISTFFAFLGPLSFPLPRFVCFFAGVLFPDKYNVICATSACGQCLLKASQSFCFDSFSDSKVHELDCEFLGAGHGT